MRGLWVAVWLGLAGVAAADPYCKPDAAELTALPGVLAGNWQGTVMQGVAVQAGKPSLLPTEGQATPAVLTATGAAISFADATTPAPVVLTAATGAVDFALPGESPLGGDELLGPLLAENRCAVGDLAQFAGALALAQGMVARFHAYVVAQDQLLMVMQVGRVGPVAQPDGTAVRVVVRYQR